MPTARKTLRWTGGCCFHLCDYVLVLGLDASREGCSLLNPRIQAVYSRWYYYFRLDTDPVLKCPLLHIISHTPLVDVDSRQRIRIRTYTRTQQTAAVRSRIITIPQKKTNCVWSVCCTYDTSVVPGTWYSSRNDIYLLSRSKEVSAVRTHVVRYLGLPLLARNTESTAENPDT